MTSHLRGMRLNYQQPPSFYDLLGNDLNWVNDSASCAQIDSDPFFPERGETNALAKAICTRCPLLEPCRAYALKQGAELLGVWGGLSELERRDIRMGRRRFRAAS